MRTLIIAFVFLSQLGNKCKQLGYEWYKDKQIAIHKEMAEKAYNDYQEQLHLQYNALEQVIAEDGYVGTFELTAYEETGNACADGQYPQVGYTVASNDSRLWHRWIYIDGYGTYYVHDTGGMATNVIDIYLADVDACIQFGRVKGVNVYIVE